MRPFLARRYDRFTAAMEDAWLDSARAELVSGAAGTIVEIGAGTGKNIRHYPSTVERLVLTEPVAAMRDQLRERAASSTPDSFSIEIVDATADRLPVPTATADVVVATLVLCSVPDLGAAVEEIRRVLRPDGSLLLIEHVAAANPRERRWQSRLDPVWTWLEGSCHLDHDTPAALAAAGFDVSGLDRRHPPRQPPLFRDVLVGRAPLV